MNTIIFIICLLISIASFIISIFNFKEKGFLFNNAYIYASKEEKNKMNKKPYYYQTGIVFISISIIFLLNAIQIITKLKLLFYIIIAIAVITVIYAVISSIVIEKQKLKKTSTTNTK